MATRKKAPQTLVLDAALSDDSDAVTILNYPDEVQAALCPSCGELLAWHEAACITAPEAAVRQQHPLAQPGEETSAPAPFAYALGQFVQPAPEAPARPVIWRGQVKERHPRTGLIHRVNVYRLDNGYWDCYHEVELQHA